MAINALQSASTGLSALNTALDITSNNLANINTDGFKTSRPNFQDLYYIEKARPGVLNSNGDSTPTGLYVGLGVKVSGTQLNFEQGSPKTTGRALDIMIQGNGFLKVQVDDSIGDGTAYTRAGNLGINKDGELVMTNDQGRRIEPVISIPENAEGIEITSDGHVLVTLPGQVDQQDVGQLELTTFINPQGLAQVGENLYVETEGSGSPITGNPGEDNRGQLQQGFLEASNADPTRELIDLIRIQRAFEMNSQTIRAADETLRAIANLRR